MTDAREWLDQVVARTNAVTDESRALGEWIWSAKADLGVTANALTAVLDLLDGPRAAVTGHVTTADLRTAITNALEGSTS